MSRLIIAGSRDLWLGPETIADLINQFLGEVPVTEIVSGACGIDYDDPDRERMDASGIDGCGEALAQAADIQIKRFYAQWTRKGRGAGPARNLEMAEYADMALVIHTGSKGSMNMIKMMERLEKPVFEVHLK
jgi:hypothetical protein